MFSGLQFGFRDEIEFSADGQLGVFFQARDKDTQELWTFTLSNLKATPSGSTLSKPSPPFPFKLSHDGHRVLWWEDSKLVVWDRVENSKNELPCKSGGSFVSQLTPFRVSPSGMLVGAICEPDLATKNGYTLNASPKDQLLVWNIDSLEKVSTIDVDTFSDSFAFSPDDKYVALGGETIKVTEIATRISFELGKAAPRSADTVGADRKSTTSLAFAYREFTLLASTEDSTKGPNGTIEVWDLIGRIKKISITPQDFKNIAVSPSGFVAAVSDDGSIVLSRGLREKPVARLIGIGDRDWLVVTANGLFDGSADAMKWVGWRLGGGSQVLSLDLFFDELYHPGLLAEIARGSIPSLPAGLDISVFLRIPGLRTILRQDRVTPKINRDRRVVLCFQDRNAFTAVKTLVGPGGSSLSESDDPDCPLVAMLPENSNPESVLKSLQDLYQRCQL